MQNVNPILDFNFNRWPPSANKAYFQRGHHRIKQPEFIAWENFCHIYIRHKRLSLPENKILRVEYQYLSPDWYNKSKTSKSIVKKIDVDNLIKLATDGIFRALDIDDSWIFKISAEKIWGNIKSMNIKIFVENDDILLG